jgi:hypothetical protein
LRLQARPVLGALAVSRPFLVRQLFEPMALLPLASLRLFNLISDETQHGDHYGRQCKRNHAKRQQAFHSQTSGNL